MFGILRFRVSLQVNRNRAFSTAIIRNYGIDKPLPPRPEGDEKESLETIFAKELIRDSNLYKGLAFTPEERELFRLKGVLPPAVIPLDKQLQQVSSILDHVGDSGLTQFMRLMALYDLNKKMFFSFVERNFDLILNVLYAPFIGVVCMDYSLVFSRPRCLYITINDKGSVKRVIENWPHKDVKVVIVTDGEKVFDLGDLGINSEPMSVGKKILYTAVAGLKPAASMPVIIDVGTNNEVYLKERLYNGLKHKRVRGEMYDELLDECMCSIREVFGPSTIIHMESFGKANSHRLLQKYRDFFCCFNNDFQCTGAVIVSGLLIGAKIVKKSLSELKFVFYGAGECNLGIGRLLKAALVRHGMTEGEALGNMHFIDTKGLVIKNRDWTPDHPKLPFARDLDPLPDLLSVIKEYKPDVLIGASGTPGTFTKEILGTMANQVENPLIFSLSNPLERTECTAEEAAKHTDGRAIYVSSYPFAPVNYKGKKFYTSQANTCYINTMAVAANLTGIKSITDDLLLEAAWSLAKYVTEDDMDKRCVYPSLHRIRQIATLMIVDLIRYAYDEKLATVFPEPTDKKEYYLSSVYKTAYPDVDYYKDAFASLKPSGETQ